MSLLLHPGSPLVIGHRGAAAVRPENTLPSFQHALALGVDAVEFDVRVTGDGVAVVHHDASTLRTCGEHLLIDRVSIGALRRLDAAATFGGDWRASRQTPIPLLDEVLELTRGVPVIIECKTVDAAPAVIDALSSHGAAERALVGSFLHGAMRYVRAAALPSGASRRDMLAMLLRGVVRYRPRRLPFAAMCIPEVSSGVTLPLERFAAWGRAIGVPVHVWTVNAAADAMRLWDAGVTGILSDDPEAILRAREERERR
ncbi:MAG: glycerophosphodiester phosphodiesterase family protein [Gemmatimonadaceae bacterium]|nr:glycerophosphodiester phosphodiesterase family protein [Gemmatimonadaceae bacterium]